MRSIRLLLSLLLQCAAVSVAFSQATLTNPIEEKRDDGSLIRYYLEPGNAERGAKNLLVVLQGSDCNSVRRIPAIKRLRAVDPEADLLTVEKYGITDELSYRVEAPGEDCPKAYVERDCPEQRVSDLVQVIKALRQTKNYDKVIVLGGSEGALVANLMTSRVDSIDATILLGGGGPRFLDDVIHSMKFTTNSEEEWKKNVEGFTQFAHYVVTAQPFELSMGNHGYRWWRGMLSLDQEESLRKVDTPVLILQGGRDQSASPEKATEMVERLKEEGKSNITYLFYPEHNHSLNLSMDDGSSEKVIRDIKLWLDDL